MNFSFFKDSLYITPDSVSGFHCRGDNRKRVAIVYPKRDESKEHLILLDKILRAASFDPAEDLSIVVYETDGPLWSVLRDREIETVLLFKDSEPSLGLQAQLPPYEPIQLNGVCFIQSHPLPMLSENQEYKRQLWEVIQKKILD